MSTVIPRHSGRPAPLACPPRDPPCFLCPVCAEDLFEGDRVRDRPCRHVAIAREHNGDLCCWDDSLLQLVVEAWRRSERTGAPILDLLFHWLGPEYVFYELLESAEPSPTARTVVVRGAPSGAARELP